MTVIAMTSESGSGVSSGAAPVPRAARDLHPYQLHAYAAWHSLTRAWRVLRAAQLTVARAAMSSDDRGTIQAWRPGSGVTGGSGVGAGLDARLLDTLSSQAAEIQYLTEIHEACSHDVWQAHWLALSDLGGLPAGTALDQLAAALDLVQPATARDICSWLSSSDCRLRRVLRMEPHQRPLPGNPGCPVCTVRMLRVQVSAPDRSEWSVVCTVPCRCSGEHCPCGMPVRERGVEHIWRYDSSFLGTT